MYRTNNSITSSYYMVGFSLRDEKELTVHHRFALFNSMQCHANIRTLLTRSRLIDQEHLLASTLSPSHRHADIKALRRVPGARRHAGPAMAERRLRGIAVLPQHHLLLTFSITSGFSARGRLRSSAPLLYAFPRHAERYAHLLRSCAGCRE